MKALDPILCTGTTNRTELKRTCPVGTIEHVREFVKLLICSCHAGFVVRKRVFVAWQNIPNTPKIPVLGILL
jgi:hypothetical protein